jgi:hypothetical protein
MPTTFKSIRTVEEGVDTTGVGGVGRFGWRWLSGAIAMGGSWAEPL